MGSKGHELHNRVEFKRTATNLFSTSVAKRSDLEKKKIEEFVRSELSLDLLGFQFDSLGAELTGRRSAVLATRMLATNVLRRASRGVSE